MHLKKSFYRIPFLALLLLTSAQAAHAHFIWLAPAPESNQDSQTQSDSKPQTMNVYFSESPEAGEPELLERLKNLQAWRVDSQSTVHAIQPTVQPESIQLNPTSLPDDGYSGLVVASLEYGVMQRDAEPFRLVYVAKSGPEAPADVWSKPLPTDLVPLDLQLVFKHGNLEVTATRSGEPAAECEVKLQGPIESSDADSDPLTGITDADGKFTFTLQHAGRYGVRVRHEDPTAGKLGDKPYAMTKTYATATIDVPRAHIATTFDEQFRLADLPTTLTSFGAAMIDQNVYVYGGTTGGAHNYYKGVQSGDLRRLRVQSDDSSVAQWETISTGPELQGLAMVSNQGKLYRLGGFEAKNAQGDEDDLWSTASVACFDPATKTWTNMPPLPEPRSSFDAAVIDRTIYVAGGWSMQGDAPRKWHTTAWKLDLSAASPQWQPLAAQPFERRAVAVATFDGKLYVIGGISSGDDTVNDVEIYDPASDQWTKGPSLIGDDRLTGFGTSAFALGEHLYVTGLPGTVQRLGKNAEQWEAIGQLPTPRFFHRMLPLENQRMILIGGSNMAGRVTKCDVLMLP